jgi:hypothetical protein
MVVLPVRFHHDGGKLAREVRSRTESGLPDSTVIEVK